MRLVRFTGTVGKVKRGGSVGHVAFPESDASPFAGSTAKAVEPA
jgi:hypothetical protein